MTDTHLSPIETPQGLVKRLAYHFTRKRFGRVPTPIKVHLGPVATPVWITKNSVPDVDWGRCRTSRRR
jgi:hypothetical protein